MGRGIEDYDEITLSTLGGGALEEKFQVELKRVLENIADLNAKDGKREISLKIVFVPSSDRKRTAIEISTGHKIQGDLDYESQGYIGKQGAQLKIWEHNPEQFQLPVGDGHIKPAVNNKTIGGLSK